MAAPLSIRLPEQTLKRLGTQAESAHQPLRTLAQRYVEEGLRMDEHPMIRFAGGPAGRRARLVGTGLDVWEAIEVIRDNGSDLDAAGEYLEIDPGKLGAAVSYYGSYSAEIDQMIAANNRAATEARDAWQAGMDALAG